MKKNFKKNKIKQPNQAKTSKLVLMVMGLVFVLACIQLVISHQLATAGGKIRRLEEEARYLEEESRILAEQISRGGSLSKIVVKAEDLGLVRTTRVIHLTPQVSVALR